MNIYSIYIYSIYCTERCRSFYSILVFFGMPVCLQNREILTCGSSQLPTVSKSWFTSKLRTMTNSWQRWKGAKVVGNFWNLPVPKITTIFSISIFSVSKMGNGCVYHVFSFCKKKARRLRCCHLSWEPCTISIRILWEIWIFLPSQQNLHEMADIRRFRLLDLWFIGSKKDTPLDRMPHLPTIQCRTFRTKGMATNKACRRHTVPWLLRR